MKNTSLREVARTYFEGVPPSHDWHHVRRVRHLTHNLASEEGADTDVLDPAALLHDIGRKKEDRGEIDDHARWGAREAAEILEERGVEPQRIEAIYHCILAHRYSNDVDPETLEAKILSDADNLDAMGATGIARAFSYSGETGRALAVDQSDGTGGTETSTTGLDHLEEKILNLRNRLYTESARDLAGERHDYVKTFVEQLKNELSF